MYPICHSLNESIHFKMGVNVSLSGVPLQPLAADGCPSEILEDPQLSLNV